MRIDSRRVLLIALALGVCGVVVAKRVLSPALPETAADSPPLPTLDAGDPEVRRMLGWFARDDGSLFRSCAIDQPNRFRIASTPGYRPGARQRELSITHRDDGASLEYFERPFPDAQGSPEAIHARVAIDPAERSELDKLFAAAGYPRKLAPTDGRVCADAGTTLVESCQAGRYFVVFRGCGAEDIVRLADDAFTFASDKVATRGKPVAPVAVTLDGKITFSRHGAFVAVDGSDDSYAMNVPDDIVANEDIQWLLKKGGVLGGRREPVRGRFTGVLKGPASVAWFELQSAEDLQLVEE